MIALSGLFAWAGSTLGAFDVAAEAITQSTDRGWLVLLMVMALLLVAGMILDGVSIYLITIPILIPIAAAFDWNMTWFGILMAMNVAIGQFTPPVAVNLIVAAQVSGVRIESTVPWVLWMVLSMALALAAVIFFPQIALWLPETLGYRV